MKISTNTDLNGNRTLALQFGRGPTMLLSVSQTQQLVDHVRQDFPEQPADFPDGLELDWFCPMSRCGGRKTVRNPIRPNDCRCDSCGHRVNRAFLESMLRSKLAGEVS
tara:strand:- start:5473 stop:5796 length:324 start_codon:yes stop_codon:yes gene_type:complete